MKQLYRHLKSIFLMYIEYGIAGEAARLSYYMLFAFFPLLLLISTVLGKIQWESFILPLDALIPQQIKEIALDYILELEGAKSGRIIGAGALLTVWSLARYVRFYRRSIKSIYGYSRKTSVVQDWSISFLFSAGMLLLFCLAVFVVFTTDKFLLALSSSLFVTQLWGILRFLLLGAYAFFVIMSLHFAECGVKRSFFSFTPGVLSCVAVWGAVSAVFSYYVEKFSDYSFVYGTVGNVILLLIFLNLTNIVLLLSAVVNISLNKKT